MNTECIGCDKHCEYLFWDVKVILDVTVSYHKMVITPATEETVTEHALEEPFKLIFDVAKWYAYDHTRKRSYSKETMHFLRKCTTYFMANSYTL